MLNAADEVAVAAFLDGSLRFPQIADYVGAALAEHTVVKEPSLEDIEGADQWAREFVNQRVAGSYTNSGVA